MNNKIQEITDKLYKEGVERGNLQAQKIVDEAHKREDALVREAEMKAEKIVADARRDAEAMKRSTEAEIQLYCKQAMESLKMALTDVICGKIVDLKTIFEDKDFLRGMIMTMVVEWAKKGELIVSVDSSLELTKYFEVKAKELLDRSVTIDEVNGKSTSFTIAPKDGSYKIEFGESEFEEYFIDFVRPQLVDMLFKK